MMKQCITCLLLAISVYCYAQSELRFIAGLGASTFNDTYASAANRVEVGFQLIDPKNSKWQFAPAFTISTVGQKGIVRPEFSSSINGRYSVGEFSAEAGFYCAMVFNGSTESKIGPDVGPRASIMYCGNLVSIGLCYCRSALDVMTNRKSTTTTVVAGFRIR